MAGLNRRQFMASAGVTGALSLAGCATIFDQRAGPTDVDGREVIVENDTDQRKTVTVEIIAEDGSPLFTRTYTLQSGHADQTGALHDDPTGSTIHVSSDGYEPISEPYIPRTDSRNPNSDLPPDACSLMDILIIIGDNELAVTYACP